MIRLTDRAFLAELIVPFLIGLLAFLMMLVGNTLYALLDQMMQQKWPVAFVARVLLFNIPTVLVLTLPIAGTVATSLAVSRMARDQELTALRAAGISLRRIFAPLVAVGLVLSVADFYLFDRVVPWAWREQNDVEQLLGNLPTNPIDNTSTITADTGADRYAFTFSKAQRLGANSRTYRLFDVLVVQQNAATSPWPLVHHAATADYTSGLFTLKDVRTSVFHSDGTLTQWLRAESLELALRIDFARGISLTSGEHLENLSLGELGTQITQLRSAQNVSRRRVLEAKFWRKLALPALCLPLTLLAAPLALRFSRTGTFTALLLSLVLVFLASLGLDGMEIAAINGYVPASVALFVPTLVALALAAILIRRQE